MNVDVGPHLRALGDLEAEMAERLEESPPRLGREDALMEIIEHIPTVIQDAKRHRDDATWDIADAAAIWYELATVKGHGEIPCRRARWRALAAEVGLSAKTLETHATTAAIFPPTGPDDPMHRRSEDEYLTFEHHRIAAHSDDPRGWIERAEAENLSTRQLRALIAAAEGTPAPEACKERERIVWCIRQAKRVEPGECEVCPWRGEKG